MTIYYKCKHTWIRMACQVSTLVAFKKPGLHCQADIECRADMGSGLRFAVDREAGLKNFSLQFLLSKQINVLIGE